MFYFYLFFAFLHASVCRCFLCCFPWKLEILVEAAASSILDPFYPRLHGAGVSEGSIPAELAAGFTPPQHDRRSAQEQGQAQVRSLWHPTALCLLTLDSWVGGGTMSSSDAARVQSTVSAPLLLPSFLGVGVSFACSRLRGFKPEEKRFGSLGSGVFGLPWRLL